MITAIIKIVGVIAIIYVICKIAIWSVKGAYKGIIWSVDTCVGAFNQYKTGQGSSFSFQEVLSTIAVAVAATWAFKKFLRIVEFTLAMILAFAGFWFVSFCAMFLEGQNFRNLLHWLY